MGFRFGFLSGFGAGYYLGARAGRQRYEQINRAVDKARRSPAVETATEKARSVVSRDSGDEGEGGRDAGDRAGGLGDTLPVLSPETIPAVPAETAVVDPGDYSSSR